MSNTRLFENEYQEFRARAAISCMSGAIARPWAETESVPDMADMSILAAEVLLDRLGLVNPDAVCHQRP